MLTLRIMNRALNECNDSIEFATRRVADLTEAVIIADENGDMEGATILSGSLLEWSSKLSVAKSDFDDINSIIQEIEMGVAV